MLQRLIDRLQRECGIVGMEPAGLMQAEVDKLVPSFVDHLLLAARRGPVTIVIDGVDRLAEYDGGPDLLWVPRELPAGAAIVLSTRPGRTLDAARDRGLTVIELPALEPMERRAAVCAYLGHFRKALSPERLEHLIAPSATGNPRFLRTMLDRLRVFGRHEALDEAIADWTAAQDLPKLHDRLLAELEADHGPHLVADVFTLLAASRRGLAEAELRDLAGGGGLGMAVLSPLLVNAAGLIDRLGNRLTLADESLGAEILARYVATSNREALHRRLADYVATRDETRQAEELLWQLERCGDLTLLARALASPALLTALEVAGRLGEALAAWQVVEDAGGARMTETYGDAIESPGAMPDHAARVGQLLLTGGYSADAKELFVWLVNTHRFSSGNKRDEVIARIYLAFVAGSYALATMRLAEAKGLARNLGDVVLEATATAEFGNLLLQGGANDDAIPRFREAASLFEAAGSTLNHGSALNNLGIAQERAGKRKKALQTWREAEKLGERAGAVALVARAVAHQGGVLFFSGDLDGAAIALARAQRLFYQIGDDMGLLLSVTNLLMIAATGRKPETGMPLLVYGENLAKRLAPSDTVARFHEVTFLFCMRPELASPEWAQGTNWVPLGLASLQRAMDMRQRVGGNEKLQHCLALAAAIRRKAGDELTAQLFELKAKGLATEPVVTAQSARGQREDERFLPTHDYFIALYRSDEDWIRQIERARQARPQDLIDELEYRGFALRRQGRCDEAIESFDEMATAARAIGDLETVFNSFHEKAIAAGMAGRSAEAARFALGQLDYATELGGAARIAVAVRHCAELGGAELSPAPSDLESMAVRARLHPDPQVRVDGGIALAAATFLPGPLRRALLEEAVASADALGQPDRATAARDATAALS
jgi:tetratricopeptide (TPR) repeat protein